MAALRTISLRLRGTSTKELEEAGEDTTGVVESKSKLRTKIQGYTGIDILTDSGAYKSTYEILLEISKVWDDLTDQDRAGLLELIAGKTRSNTAAAILSNTKDLEAAFESAQNAEGSALRENEKYLDSIQGRIDLFNNAVQTMWKNTLNDDVVKWFVNLGTGLIKFIDKLGLIPSLLGGVFIYFTAFKKNNPITFIKDIGQTFLNAGLQASRYGTSLKNLTLQQQASKMATAGLTQQEIATQLVKQNNIEQSKAEALAEEAVTAAKIKQQGVTAEQVLSAWAKNQISLSSQAADWLEKQSTEALTRAKLQEALASGAITKQDYLEIAAKYGLLSATEALKLGVQGLTASIKASMASNPIGWAMLAISVIISLVSWISSLKSQTEKLSEKLDNLKSEISTIKGEIESLNSELETTQSRMAELLAMDSLSFTEQEELSNLQKQNDELERQIYLLEQRQKRKQKEAEEAFVKTVGSDLESHVNMMGNTTSITTEQYIESNIGAYKAAQEEARIAEDALIQAEKDLENAKTDKEKKQSKKEVKKAEKEYNKKKKEADIYYDYVSDKIEEYAKYADGIDYDVADEETKELLDYIYNLEDKFNIVNGDDKAKSIAIKRIFNKEEFADASESIDELVKKLKDDPSNSGIKNEIQSIIEENVNLKTSLEEVGLSAAEATDYFTMFASSTSFETIDGKINELSKANDIFENLLNGQKFNIEGAEIGLADLFDEEGKIVQTKLSQIFNDTSDQTRKDITAILEGSYDEIKNGTYKIENLLTTFGLKASRQIINVSKNDLSTYNKEMFPGLEDEISGIIDTFDELASAIGSVSDAMDTLDQARKEEVHSGSISIETLSALMKYTDDYAKIVRIDETGAIHLAKDAQQILIQEKINAIKANAELAVQEAQTALAEAQHAQVMNGAPTIAHQAFNTVVDQTTGAIAALGSIFSDVKKIIGGDLSAASGMLSRAAAARNNIISSKYNTRQAGADSAVTKAEEALRKAEDNLKIANGLTPENVQKRYQSDKADGSDKDGDDNRLEKLQKKYERQISNLDNQQTYLENEIERLEAENEGVSKSYYEKEIDIEEKKLDLYEAERAELKSLQAATKEGSDSWWEISEALWETEHAIQESTLRMIEFRKSIVELYETAFDRISDAYDNKTSLIDDQLSSLQNYAELLELDGVTPTASLYQEQQARIAERMAANQAKLASTEQIITDLKAEQAKYAVGSADWNYYDELLVSKRAEQRQYKLDIQTDQKDWKQVEQDFKDAILSAWDDVMDAFSNKNAFFEAQQGFVDSYISRLETLNINIPDSAYKKQIEIQDKINKNNANALSRANSELDTIGAKFGIDSKEYLEKQMEVIELEQQLYEGETKNLEYQQQIIENQIDKFNQVLDRINNSVDNMKNISGLISDEDVATEDGDWTAEGLTRLGLAYQEREYQKQSIEEIGEKMEWLTKQYKQGKISEKEYYEQMSALEDQQWDSINAYKETEDAIVELNEARIDMIEEGLNKEIEAYQELIDLKKEALDAERDLYTFRKDIEKQTKDIASLERRIASMSGSTDASTIAERTRLEAQLREAKTGLDDTYIGHAYDSTSQALDKELDAMQKSSDDYIEHLREQIENTDILIEETYKKVVENGTLVLETLTTLSSEYGFEIDSNLIAPWQNATNRSLDFEYWATIHYNNVKDVVNNGTPGFITNITQPWKDGQTAAQTFSQTVPGLYDVVINKAKNNQDNLKNYLSKPWEYVGNVVQQTVSDASKAIDRLIGEAQDAAKKINQSLNISTPSYTTNKTSTSTNNGSTSNNSNKNTTKVTNTNNKTTTPEPTIYSVYGITSAQVTSAGLGPISLTGFENMLRNYEIGLYSVNGKPNVRKATAAEKRMKILYQIPIAVSGPNAIKKHAKGVFDTKKDHWAITDEPQYGDELTLVPGKDGNLSFMRKGTGVVPADLTKKIFEIAQMPMDEFGKNIVNAVVPNIETTNQAINVNFEALVKADNITNDILPEVEKMVEKQLNTFTRNLNYSIKKFK